MCASEVSVRHTGVGRRAPGYQTVTSIPFHHLTGEKP